MHWTGKIIILLFSLSERLPDCLNELYEIRVLSFARSLVEDERLLLASLCYCGQLDEHWIASILKHEDWWMILTLWRIFFSMTESKVCIPRFVWPFIYVNSYFISTYSLAFFLRNSLVNDHTSHYVMSLSMNTSRRSSSNLITVLQISTRTPNMLSLCNACLDIGLRRCCAARHSQPGDIVSTASPVLKVSETIGTSDS